MCNYVVLCVGVLDNWKNILLYTRSKAFMYSILCFNPVFLSVSQLVCLSVCLSIKAITCIPHHFPFFLENGSTNYFKNTDETRFLKDFPCKKKKKSYIARFSRFFWCLLKNSNKVFLIFVYMQSLILLTSRKNHTYLKIHFANGF